MLARQTETAQAGQGILGRFGSTISSEADSDAISPHWPTPLWARGQTSPYDLALGGSVLPDYFYVPRLPECPASGGRDRYLAKVGSGILYRFQETTTQASVRSVEPVSRSI